MKSISKITLSSIVGLLFTIWLPVSAVIPTRPMEPALIGPPAPSLTALKSSPVAPKVDDLLDKEIGSGRVLKITFKDGKTKLVTMQGRNDKGFIAEQVHFFAPPIGFTQGAVSDHYLSDSEAITMLESEPESYILQHIHTCPYQEIDIEASDIVRLEWVRVPTPVPSIIQPDQKPTIRNPSVFSLWP